MAKYFSAFTLTWSTTSTYDGLSDSINKSARPSPQPGLPDHFTTDYAAHMWHLIADTTIFTSLLGDKILSEHSSRSIARLQEKTHKRYKNLLPRRHTAAGESTK